MQYLADTVAIIRHFASVGKIGKAAKSILQDADNGKNKILISIISIVEILYLSERNRIPREIRHCAGQDLGGDRAGRVSVHCEVSFPSGFQVQ